MALCTAGLAQGRIVVAHDEWTLSDFGFSQAPSAAQFAQNVVSWLVGGQPANVRAWSNNFGVSQSALANAMNAAGHTWTVSTSGSFDLATLQQYDAVFVVGDPIDIGVLTQYVNGGGNVYAAAGTGYSYGNLDTFLNQFGLQLSPLNNFTETYAITSPHPVFAGVSSLFHDNGNSVSLTAGATNAQVLVAKNGLGLYAVYDVALAVAANLPFGAGCNGPVLTGTTRPITGTPWQLGLGGIPSGAVAGFFLLGLSNPDLPLAPQAPGCTQYTDALGQVLVLPPLGAPTYSMAIPSGAPILGLQLYAQAGAFVPGLNAYSLALSNGLIGTVGDS